MADGVVMTPFDPDDSSDFDDPLDSSDFDMLDDLKLEICQTFEFSKTRKSRT